MYFEGRELRPYGEYLKSADLVVERVSFRVSYLDEDMAIPELVPLVFIGRDLSPDQPGLYFQDAASFLSGKRWGDADDPTDSETDGSDFTSGRPHAGWFENESEGTYSGVYSFDKALDCLLACSLERLKWDGEARPIEPPADME